MASGRHIWPCEGCANRRGASWRSSYRHRGGYCGLGRHRISDGAFILYIDLSAPKQPEAPKAPEPVKEPEPVAAPPAVAAFRPPQGDLFA